MYPSGYDILIPKSLRRDSGRSNILFVQKETKTVMTLFGWDIESNLVTYSEYLEAPTPISANTDVTILAEIPEFLVTDLGSAVGYKQGTHHWMNLAHRVGQDNLNLYGEIGFSSVPFAPDSIGVNVGSKVTLVSGGFLQNFTQQHALNVVSKPLVGIARWLVLINGELKLLVYAKYSNDNSLRTQYTGLGTVTNMLISLSGKPLSKESSDLVRSGAVVPTIWRTNPLVPLGFVDKATNKLITTNNSI